MASQRRQLPSWTILLFGVLVGVTLTTTVTFHLQWCGAIASGEDRIVRMPSMPLPVTQHHMDEHCLCGKELAALEKKLVPVSEPNSNQAAVLVSNQAAVLDSNQETDLNALSQRKNFTVQPLASPLHQTAQKPIMDGLIVGVVSKLGRPQWLESVYDTWGRDASQLLMFVGDHFNYTDPSARGLPLVRLPGVQEVGGTNMMISALQYLSDHYLSTHHWFMLAVDNSYVRIDKLQLLLSRFSPMEMLYLGRSATGRKDQAKKLGLKPHERYCLGSSGIVLSSALLAELRSDFATCLAETDLPEDVELGKCISAKLAIQCAQSDQTRPYFFEDYSGHDVTTEYIVQKGEVFPKMVAYHPVPSLSAMRVLHQHYKQIQLASLMDQLHMVERQLTDLCELAAPPTLSSSSSPPAVPDCAVPSLCPTDTKCLSAGVVSTPYQPTTIYDYQPWIYFDAVTAYLDRDVYPTYRLKAKKNLRQELKQMLSKALQKISERHGRALKFKKLVNGWFRHNPFLGNEYIVDCLLLDGGRKYITKRINLVQPLATNYITRKDNTDPATYVHVVVPLTNVNHRFQEFMEMYEQLALVKAEHVKLILSVYGKEDVEYVTKVVTGYRAKYAHADISIIEGTGKFSRGKALHNGVLHLTPDDLIFICDVDMRVEQPFLERCRKNTIPNKRVYYPEFFKLYNMNYVYWKQRRPKGIGLKRHHGHWAYYSFGMLCIYKSDYTAVGGMDTNLHGWGDEDIQFFNKVIRRRLEVLRAPDKALSHRWHEKRCSKGLAKDQYKHCVSSQLENLADRKELARYIQQMGVEIKGSVSGAVVDLAGNATAEDDEEDYDYEG